jgi:hypothetical protein
LISRSGLGGQNAAKDLKEAEMYCSDVQMHYDRFAKRVRADYLVTHAWVMVRQGEFNTRENEIRGMLAEARKMDPASVHVFDVEKELVEKLHRESDGEKPWSI